MKQDRLDRDARARFEASLERHQRGELQEAAEGYRAVLEAVPEHADSLHLLGVATYQMGGASQGAALIERAVEIDPKNASYRSDLGSVLKALGRLEEALAMFESAIECDPSALAAHYNAGDTYCQLDRLEEGEAAYRKAVELAPNLTDVWTNLGLCLIKRERDEEGERCLIQALDVEPGAPTALYGLAQLRERQGLSEEAGPLYRQAMSGGFDRASCLRGLAGVAMNQGSYEPAIDYLRQLVSLGEADAAVLSNLGMALQNSGQIAEAEEAYARALQLDPGHVDALGNLAALRYSQGRMSEAEAQARACLEIKGDHADAWNNLGLALRAQARLDAALEAFERAVAADPEAADYHGNRALALMDAGRNEEMEQAFRRALEIAPAKLSILANYAAGLLKLGRLTEAKPLLDQALEIDEACPSVLVSLGRYWSEMGRFAESEEAYRLCLEIDPGNERALQALPYGMLARDDIGDEALFEAHRASGEAFERAVEPFELPAALDLAQRPLRVGLLSADFRTHSVAYFLEPLMAHLEPGRFELIAYSSATKPDATTQRLKALAAGWRDVAGLSDEALAERIREDKIDALIDLSGYTSGCRSKTLARRSAPLQVGYLGYPHSSGMSRMDYRIVDSVTDPEGMTLNTERLARLPRCFLCYRPDADAPEVAPPPSAEKGEIVFGSFNNFVKLTDKGVRRFARALARTPGSRLLIKGHHGADPSMKERLLSRFAACGVEADRIELAGRTPSKRDHLALYGSVDIALDTYPYNGTTTTCEALWMGVPVVTQAGRRHASRVSASLLESIGLGELVAESEEGFAEIAAALARDPERLASLRRGLRERMESSPLRDEKGFAAAFGNVLEEMWLERRLEVRPRG